MRSAVGLQVLWLSVLAATAVAHRRRRRSTWRTMSCRVLATVVTAVVALCAVAPASMAAPASPAVPTQAIRAQLGASHVPAAAYAVISGEDVDAGGWGEGISARTPFVLGSISKSFTALAVMQLVDRGDVGLNAPLTRYMPEFHGAEPNAAITVRQLLDQTSGLPTAACQDVLSHPEVPLRQRVQAAARAQLSTVPGAAFQYCNLNYGILGYLVEKVSRRSFAEYVEQHIFQPLDMQDSSTSTAAALAHGMPEGSTVWFGATVTQSTPNAAGALPDGYLISTAADMTHYLQMQLNDGVYRGRQVVSAESLRLMHTAWTPTPVDAAAEFTSSYGFGWAVGTVHGQQLLAHDGDTSGYHANMALLADTRQALVVLTARNGLLTEPSSAYRAGLHALAGKPAAHPDNSFIRTYALLDAAALLTVLLMLISLARRPRWAAKLPLRAAQRGRLRALLPPVARDLLLSAAVYLGVYFSTLRGLSLRIAFEFAPDAITLVLLIVAFFALKALTDLSLGLLATRGHTEHRP